jgi:hypothetical protein
MPISSHGITIATSGAWPRPGVPHGGSTVPRAPRSERLTVYAIVRSRGPASLRTGDGQRLDLVASGAIAAVVRRQSRAPGSSPADLRRYDGIMGELALRFPAMLPARFGTVLAADELAFILTSRRDALVRALANVRGRAQMTVRVVNATGTKRPVAAAPSGRTSTSRRGRDYLLTRAREATAQREVAGFEPVGAAVAKYVRDERVEHAGGVSTIYHLIPRGASELYRQALLHAAAVSGVPAVVSGPWPPYAFAAAD